MFLMGDRQGETMSTKTVFMEDNILLKVMGKTVKPRVSGTWYMLLVDVDELPQ